MNKLAISGGQKAINVSDIHYEWPILSDNTIRAVNSYLLDRNPLSISEKKGIVKDLEDEVAKYNNIKYVLSTNSGSNALYAAYVALNLERGSEVIVQNVTFHASITPAMHCGLSPVLVDVESETGNISVASIEKAITPKTKAIVVNHTWGHPADMDEIKKICTMHKLKLIEDCSHSFGATYKGKKVGTFGDISVVSMQASKMVSAGEGGLLMTNNDLYYQRACLVGHYRGRSEVDITYEELSKYGDTGMGLKFRIHPIAAVIAYNELLLLEKKIKMRKNLLGRLSHALENIKGIRPPYISADVTMGSFYGYKPQFVPEELKMNGKYIDCDTYIDILNKEGVDIHRPSVKPLDMLPIFTDNPKPFKCIEDTWHPRVSGTLLGSKKYFENRLSLPTFTYSNKIVDLYIKAFQKVSDWLG